MTNLKMEFRDAETPLKSAEGEQLHFIPGIWVDGKACWITNAGEKIFYEEQVLIKTHMEQIHSKIRFFNIYVSSQSTKPLNIKILMMNHHPHPGKGHFAFISPTDSVTYHLADQKLNLVNAYSKGAFKKQSTILPYWNVYTDQIWANLEKGSLKYQPMVKGDAASIITYEKIFAPKETVKIHCWSIMGDSKTELFSLDRSLLKNRLAFPFEK
jgi:hypothetical protein